MSYNLHVCCSVANKQKLSYENSNWYPEVTASIHVVDHIYRVFRLLGWSQKVNFWLHESAYIARLQGLIGKEEMWRMSWWLVGGSGWFWRWGADRGEWGVRESRCPLPIISHQQAKLFTPTSLTAAWTQYWPPLFWHCHLLDGTSDIIDQIILQLCRKNCSHFFCMSEMLTDFCSLLVQLLAKMNHSKGHDVSTRKVCYQI